MMTGTDRTALTGSRKRRRVEEPRRGQEVHTLGDSDPSDSTTCLPTAKPRFPNPRSISEGISTPGRQQRVPISRDSGYSSSGSRITEPDRNISPSKVTGVGRTSLVEGPSNGDGKEGEEDPIMIRFPKPTPSTAISTLAVDDGISEQIMKGLTTTDLCGEYGIPYTLLVDRGQFTMPLIKVGSTKGTVMARMGNVAGAHKEWKYEPAHGMDLSATRCYLRAEHLAQKELAHFRDRTKCRCGIQHREYFSLDAQIAIAAVNRWRRFCAAKPYDDSGKLRPFWAHRLRQRQFRAHAAETAGNHATCAERWDHFVDATQLDYFYFKAGYLANALRTSSQPWLWYSLAQALSFLFLPSVVTWLMSWLVVAYVCKALTVGDEVEHYLMALFGPVSIESARTGTDDMGTFPYLRGIFRWYQKIGLVLRLVGSLGLSQANGLGGWMARVSRRNLSGPQSLVKNIPA